MLDKITKDDFNAVLGPKVQVFWNLDEQLPLDLSCFTVHPSVAGIMGNTRQSSSAVENTHQDTRMASIAASCMPVHPCAKRVSANLADSVVTPTRNRAPMLSGVAGRPRARWWLASDHVCDQGLSPRATGPAAGPRRSQIFTVVGTPAMFRRVGCEQKKGMRRPGCGLLWQMDWEGESVGDDVGETSAIPWRARGRRGDPAGRDKHHPQAGNGQVD
ncbi:503cc802-55c7-45f1-915d-075b12ad1af3 [Thermothielavioides terrestris]|jgi:hypothetical protein|nr:503cc802-55c7-45f1-915d-075b12ad1af3 [Thermothielavioides terrestris]